MKKYKEYKFNPLEYTLHELLVNIGMLYNIIKDRKDINDPKKYILKHVNNFLQHLDKGTNNEKGKGIS